MRTRSYLACAFLLLIAGAARAEVTCDRLRGHDFSTVPDAVTQVTKAEAITADASDNALPPHCKVNGYVAPSTRFELFLPDDWNGRFLKRGCGGFCGVLYQGVCDAAVKQGFACIVSDMGHVSTPIDGKWGYHDDQALIDFGYRATRAVTQAGKAITAAHYGRAADRAYFEGCSTGGRQGLMAAQLFPGDYDGIIAGAPVIHWTQAAFQLAWSTLALYEGEAPVVTEAQLRAVHNAFIARCDSMDGHEDGLVPNPLRCDADPADLACGAADAPEACLDPAALAAVQRIYAGPTDSAGVALHPGRALPGSELNWLGNYLRHDGNPPLYRGFIGDMFRYLLFAADPGPDFRLEDIDWDRDPARAGFAAGMVNATNPDLRAFAARGGKIISYHGWRDQSVVPEGTIDYYRQVEKIIGSAEATRDFFRLFMLPGVNHCRGGAGADSIDYLSALVAWVEDGEAPDSLIGAHIRDGETRFTRPHFPWPLEAAYSGEGDPDDGRNWEPINP